MEDRRWNVGQLAGSAAWQPDGPLQARQSQPGQPRRDFLHASGTAGAALLAGSLLGGRLPASQHAPDSARAATARPVWLASSDTKPTTADWNALRRSLSTHKLYQPGQSGYNFAHELFSPQFDYLKPAGVAYCKRNSDVAACLSFVTKFKLPVRMRSGGHSYGGWSSVNSGLVLDVSEMNSMSVGSNTVTVGTGIDLINFYGGLAAHGKAVPGGSCPTVGIAGLTLGGGIGVLARIYGLTSDNLKSLQVVTCRRQHRDLQFRQPQRPVLGQPRRRRRQLRRRHLVHLRHA